MRYRTLTVTAALTAASLTGITPAAAATPATTVTVGLRPGATAAETVRSLHTDPAVRVVDSDLATGLDAVTVTVTGDPARAIEALAADPGVAYVERIPVASIDRTPDDTLYPRQWGSRLIQAPAAWDVTTGSASVTVAVVDTGVTAVSELAGRVLPGYDFVNDDADPSDDNGHGTMAASVVAASGGNGSGLAGMCWTCRILPVKVMDADGSGGHDDIAKGIVYAVDHGADVINLSLGGPASSQILTDAVAYAADHGVMVVASAGNDGLTAPSYPAAYPSAIAVAGSTDTDTRYDWSNYNPAGNPWVDLAAPGVNAAQGADGRYYWFTGTSSAGPVVAGIAALGLSAGPQTTASQVRAAMEATADPVGTWVAAGRVNAEGTVARLATATDVTAPAVAWSAPATSSTPRRGRVTVTATASDKSGIAKVELLRAGRVVGTDTAAPWSITFDSAGLDGTQMLTLRATDSVGNAASANRSLLFDNTAPTLTNVGFSAARKASSGALKGTVTITPTARDNIGIDQVTAVVTAGSTKTTLTSAKSPWTTTWKPGTRTGVFPVTVSVTDRAGNTKTITTKVKITN